MSSQPDRPAQRQRRYLGWVYIAQGFVGGTWITRLPDIKAHAAVSNGQLGVTFFVCSLAAVVMGLTARPVLARLRTGPRAFAVEVAYVLTALSLGWASSYLTLVVAALAMGVTCTLASVSRCSAGVRIELRSEHKVVSHLQALGAIGALAAGAATVAANWLGQSMRIQFVEAGVAAIVLDIAIVKAWPVARSLTSPGRAIMPPASLLRGGLPSSMFMFAVIAALGAICESVGKEWGGIYLRDELHTSRALATVPFLAFSIAVIAGRFSADRLTKRFSAVGVIRSLALLAALALMVGLAINQPVALIASFGLLGFGIAAISPTVTRAAAEASSNDGAGLGLMSSATAVGFLCGPPIVGSLADVSSLRLAMLFICAACIAVAAASNALLTASLRSENAARTARDFGAGSSDFVQG